ncbi:class I SAM-dependent methyltransferase [soil metagenome]
MKNWFPDELIYAGEEHLDPDYVEGYDNKAQTDPTEDVEILRGLGMNETSTVIDLGAGTGVVALALAPLCNRVIAVDVSDAMNANLSRAAARDGIGNLEVVHGGFLSYQPDEAVDFVYSRNALHHLSDFWKVIALQRIAAMLKSGGVLRLRDLVYSFPLEETETKIDTWLAGGTATSDRGWTSEELATHVRTEFSTFNWLLEPMLERAGFEIRDVWHSPVGAYSAYTCVMVG